MKRHPRQRALWACNANIHISFNEYLNDLGLLAGKKKLKRPQVQEKIDKVNALLSLIALDVYDDITSQPIPDEIQTKYPLDFDIPLEDELEDEES